MNLKDDQSPLTLADKKSNEVINNYLSKTSIPVISEENKAVPYAARKNWNECWIVDPLDGTKEFIKRNGEFTVNIALIRNSRPALGVIYVPATKELYFADVEKRTSCKVVVNGQPDINSILGESKPLIVAATDKNTIQGGRKPVTHE